MTEDRLGTEIAEHLLRFCMKLDAPPVFDAGCSGFNKEQWA